MSEDEEGEGEGEGSSHERIRVATNSPTSLTIERRVVWTFLKESSPRDWSQSSLKRIRRDWVRVSSTSVVRGGAEEGMGRREMKPSSESSH